MPLRDTDSQTDSCLDSAAWTFRRTQKRLNLSQHANESCNRAYYEAASSCVDCTVKDETASARLTAVSSEAKTSMKVHTQLHVHRLSDVDNWHQPPQRQQQQYLRGCPGRILGFAVKFVASLSIGGTASSEAFAGVNCNLAYERNNDVTAAAADQLGDVYASGTANIHQPLCPCIFL